MTTLLTRITAVSGLCLAGMAAIPATAYAAPAGSTVSAQFSTSSIADRALEKVGGYGGQCKQFVNDVVQEATGGSVSLGGGYYSDYRREGGHRVSAANAVKGDVIQLNSASDPDTFYSGMHTAIVVANLGHHNFKVVDSNWVGPTTVGTHTWNPYNRAADKGLKVNIWHF
ncbi:hypothetical protein ACIQGZ_27750 [Streptomyces sp. NPDC092296]|uniref:hypothetical protein n=1 Tax=Streptomyces sp. NPDC092296 TaxID=3366012 RepID=UPI00381CC46B